MGPGEPVLPRGPSRRTGVSGAPAGTGVLPLVPLPPLSVSSPAALGGPPFTTPGRPRQTPFPPPDSVVIKLTGHSDSSLDAALTPALGGLG